MYKKILIVFTFVALFATTITVSLPKTFASADHSQSKISVDAKSNFTKEDILPLKKYVSVNRNGFFEFDIKKAKTDGFERNLLNGQQKHFEFLNSQIAKGYLRTSSNLNVEEIFLDKSSIPSDISDNSSCGGVTTRKTTYWWGYRKKLNSCYANRVASDFASASSVAAGVTIVVGIYGVAPAVPSGLAAAYWGLLSSRIYSNNSDNTGVILDMTWAYIFDVEPQ